MEPVLNCQQKQYSISFSVIIVPSRGRTVDMLVDMYLNHYLVYESSGIAVIVI